MNEIKFKIKILNTAIRDLNREGPKNSEILFEALKIVFNELAEQLESEDTDEASMGDDPSENYYD